jgi:hypothetical protein
VCEDPNGQISILYKGQPLEYAVFHQQQRHAEVVDSKSIDAKLNKPYKPAQDHHWRTDGRHISRKPIQKAQHETVDPS